MHPVQPPAVQRARPARAAANGVAALLLQQKLEGGLGSSGSGHARTAKPPAALPAKLKPKGATQEAAVAAETVSWRNDILINLQSFIYLQRTGLI